MNEIENKKTIQNLNTTKSWFFERLIKATNPWLDSLRKIREKTHINKTRNEREVTTDITEI